MRQIDYIAHHCTAGSQRQTVESIKKYWRVSKRWINPGYHELVMPDGDVVMLLPIEQISNGVLGYNHRLINLCYVGGVEIIKNEKAENSVGRPLDNRTPQQKKSLQERTEYHHSNFPSAIIQGHRDFSVDKNRDGIIQPNEWMKACPSYSVAEWLREINFHSRIDPHYMTTTGVNIRTGPGIQFPKVAPTLNKGVIVKYLGADKDWKYVSVEGTSIKGFVKSDYLSPNI